MDVSIWDLERVFAKGSVPIGEKAAGKRKKGELEDGEVWRARNVSQEFYSSHVSRSRGKLRTTNTTRDIDKASDVLVHSYQTTTSA